jgi:hypothetical protein
LRQLAKGAVEFATYIHNIEEMSWSEMWLLVNQWYGFVQSEQRYQELFRSQRREPGWTYGRFAALLVLWARRGYPKRRFSQIEAKVFDALVQYAKENDPAIYECYAITLTTATPVTTMQDFIRVADAWLASYPELQSDASLRTPAAKGTNSSSGFRFRKKNRNKARQSFWEQTSESDAPAATVQMSSRPTIAISSSSRDEKNSGSKQISSVGGSNERVRVSEPKAQQQTIVYTPSRFQSGSKQSPDSGNARGGEVPPPYPCPRCHKGLHWAKRCPVFPGQFRAPFNPVVSRSDEQASQQFGSHNSRSVPSRSLDPHMVQSNNHQ